jgi:hypothetical protein
MEEQKFEGQRRETRSGDLSGDLAGDLAGDFGRRFWKRLAASFRAGPYKLA